MIAITRDEVIALLDCYVVEHESEVLLPTIRSLMDHDAECVIAIQRGSGNEMSRFSEFLFLVGRAGLINDQEAMDYISRGHSNEP